MYNYTLELTDADVATIAFVGGRYEWSNALLHLESGANAIPEHEAWEIAAAFHADTEGGHSPFPMLADCELRANLREFWDAIV